MKKHGFENFLLKTGSKIIDKFKDQDSFGSSLNLMYNGSNTYKTLPGAFLTLLMKLWMMQVLYLNISDLYYKKGWTMKSQIVLLEESELIETIDIGSFKNF